MDLLARPSDTAPVSPAPTGTPGAGRDRARRLLARFWPLLAAAGSGFLLLFAFPPYDQWYLAPVAVALFALATHGRRFRAGFGLGYVAGLCLTFPLLTWVGNHVKAGLALPFMEALFFAILGGLLAVCTPVLTRWRWSWPFVVATLWVVQEALADRTPYGGFPWARLAFTQGDSPLLGLAALGGAPLVTVAVAFVGGLLALAVRLVIQTPRPWSAAARRPAVIALVAGLVLIVAPAPVLVAGSGSASGAAAQTVRVAIVQGNVPRLGLEFNEQRRAVLDNHVRGTLELARRVAAGQTPRPDFVVWPENASDIDPLDPRNADAAAVITEAAQAIGVPILVGGLRDDPDDPTKVRNVGMVWDPQTGAGDYYVKQHPVPFAEYIPGRSIVRPAVKLIGLDLNKLIPRDFAAGTWPGVMPIGSQQTMIGDVICFEVAFDDVVRDTVINGADLIVVQTNNATFDRNEALQQLAMVRLRAVEHGRDALMSSTVGVSAFVDTHGKVYDATQFNHDAVIERSMTVSTGRTLATVVGAAPELVLVIVGIGFVVLAIALRVLRVRSRRQGQVETRD